MMMDAGGMGQGSEAGPGTTAGAFPGQPPSPMSPQDQSLGALEGVKALASAAMTLAQNYPQLGEEAQVIAALCESMAKKIAVSGSREEGPVFQ